jgi:hypothetical protein
MSARQRKDALPTQAMKAIENVGLAWQRARFIERASFHFGRAGYVTDRETDKRNQTHTDDICEKARALIASIQSARAAGVDVEEMWLTTRDTKTLFGLSPELPDWYTGVHVGMENPEDSPIVRPPRREFDYSKIDRVSPFLEDLMLGIDLLEEAFFLPMVWPKRPRGGQPIDGPSAAAARLAAYEFRIAFGKWPPTEKDTAFANFITAAFPHFGLRALGPRALATAVREARSVHGAPA